MSLLLGMVLVPVLQAQTPEKKLAWNNTPLSWQDFEGVPDALNPFDANTNSGFSYSWSLSVKGGESVFLYEVKSWFFPELSWVKNGKKSQELLDHEQLHFDISELHARRLRSTLEELKIDPSSDVKKQLRVLYERTEAARIEMQEQYDAETRHGENTAAQQKWAKKVKTDLDSLSGFRTEDQ
ncbi:DUF922 domain-containing protein [Salinimicrobium soli]|uniref:DUF922 domain-containing protein n=1 Tax=Salinimicrobium soli TaxID=1254399 RepID=UPI003AB0F4D2